MKKDLEIQIFNGAPVMVKVELFHALSPRNEHRNQLLDAYNTAQGFISDNVPANTMQGINRIATAGNFRGLIGYQDVDLRAGILLQLNNAGTQETGISTTNTFAPYKSILEMIKTQPLRVGKVRVACPDLAQLRVNWEMKRYYPDGTVISKDIVISNSVSPQQVRPDIIEFDLNETIDKYTAIEIPVTPLNVAGFIITFNYDL